MTKRTGDYFSMTGEHYENGVHALTSTRTLAGHYGGDLSVSLPVTAVAEGEASRDALYAVIETMPVAWAGSEEIANRFGVTPRSIYRVLGRVSAAMPARITIPVRLCAACGALLERRPAEPAASFRKRATCNRACAGSLRATQRRGYPLADDADPGHICQREYRRPAGLSWGTFRRYRTCSGSCARRLMWRSRPRKATA